MSGYVKPSTSINFCQSPVYLSPMDCLIAEAKKVHGIVLPDEVKNRLRTTYHMWVEFYKRTQTAFFQKSTDLKRVKLKAFGESL